MSARDNHRTCPVTVDNLSVRCTVPWFICGTEYSPLDCTFKLLNCGEDTFREVYRAIKAAKHSVNYITWGFQPSMHFIRDGGTPPIGKLLEEVALRGVKARVLAWGTHPLGIDLPSGPLEEPTSPGRRVAVLPWIVDGKLTGSLDRPVTHTQDQYDYDWWWYFCYDSQQTLLDEGMKSMGARRVLDKFVPPEQQEAFLRQTILARQNLEFRSRDLSIVDRVGFYRKEFSDPNVPGVQRAFMSAFPSHHQKIIVIDVESPDDHVGFVMGHNTLDEYWDTQGHGYFRFKEQPHLGRNGEYPRQDISSRVTGPIVGDLYFNFKGAWESTTYKTLSFHIKERVDKVTEAAEKASDAASDAARTVSNTASDAARSASNTASDAASAVSNTTSDVWTSARDTASDVWTATTNTASDVLTGGKNMASDAARTVSNGVSSAWDTVAFWKSDKEKQANKVRRQAEEQRIAAQRDTEALRKEAERAAEAQKKEAERVAEAQRKQAQRQTEEQRTAAQRQAAEQEKQAQRQAEEEKIAAQRQKKEEERRWRREEDSRIRREPLPQLDACYFRGFPLYTSKLVVTEGQEPTPENIEKIKGGLADMSTGSAGGAVILRTHTTGKSEDQRLDIRDSYKHVVKMATQYIYFENQYFRWPPLADVILEAARKRSEWGAKPEENTLYVFVVTNSSEKGLGPGSQKTYEMLESLGRADAIPRIARQNRISDVKTQISQAQWEIRKLELENAAMLVGGRKTVLIKTPPPQIEENKKKIAALQEQIEKWQKQQALLEESNDDKDILPEERPGLRFHLCTLVPPDTPSKEEDPTIREWKEVYIHTKLMIINDTYMTLGSANINTRSMEVDTELNIAHSQAMISAEARKKIWAQHTGGMSVHDLHDMKNAFDVWGEIIDRNRKHEAALEKPWASLRGFLHTGTEIKRLD